MNIHEYQAKALFKEFGVPVQDGVAVKSPSEFDAAIAAIPGDNIVVKSQIHAGGRGKGVFADGFKGGVKFVYFGKETYHFRTLRYSSLQVQVHRDISNVGTGEHKKFQGHAAGLPDCGIDARM